MILSLHFPLKVRKSVFRLSFSSYQEALSYLRSKRPCVHPNDGFMHQLLLYERMGCKLDPNFKPYKLYRLVCIHNNVKQTKILPPKNLLFQTENSSNLKQSETMSGSISIAFFVICKWSVWIFLLSKLSWRSPLNSDH